MFTSKSNIYSKKWSWLTWRDASNHLLLSFLAFYGLLDSYSTSSGQLLASPLSLCRGAVQRARYAGSLPKPGKERYNLNNNGGPMFTVGG